MGASTSGAVTAGIYTGGRITTNSLSWLKTGAVVAVQAALLKQMLDKQKSAYDNIAWQQRNYVETALNNYLLDLNNNLIPTFADAYPEVPVAAPYAPVDYQVEQFSAMVASIQNLPKTAEYVKSSNYLLRTDYIARQVLLHSDWVRDVKLMSMQLGLLLAGKLPTGDVVEILSDTAQQACLTGRIGNTRKTTLRNLGISKLRAEDAARKGFHEHWGALAGSVMPFQGEATLEAQMLNPNNRMALAIQQAQLIQNSLQNINNTAAQKPPFRLGVLQAKMNAAIARLTYDANKGNMVNNFVPNYSAVLGPAMSNVFDGINKQIGGVSDEHDRHPALGAHPGESGRPSLF